MGEFFEPEPIEPLNEKVKVFTEEFLNSVVKKTIESGDVPPDHRLYFVAATDEQGIKGIVGLQYDTNHTSFKINFIAEHQWDGDNKVGAKVIFSVK